MLFLWEVGMMDEEKRGDACPDRFLWLQIMCVLVFEVAVFTEVRASANILSLLWHAPARDHTGGGRAGYAKIVAPLEQHAEPESGAIMAKQETPRSQLSKADMLLR